MTAQTRGSVGSLRNAAWVAVNGRRYRWPKRPVIVICADGCAPEYLATASQNGLTPVLDTMAREGFSARCLAAMPTFTNPNNMSIICGAPPSVHGVSGNYYLDRASGREVMMLDASLLRAPSILSAFADAGADVVAITAKDKLRLAIGKGVAGTVFSAERGPQDPAIAASLKDLLDRGLPDPYSPDLSLFVLDAGIALLGQRRVDIGYLSLSDFVQHCHGPDEPQALAFMAALDARCGHLIARGAVVGIVADHGMTDMARDDGSPRVCFLGDELDSRFGPGKTRVICPITDPFVRHHAALGGFVRVHLLDPALDVAIVRNAIASLEAVAVAISGDEACQQYDMPPDREADIVVVATRGTALGSHADAHDLSTLAGSRLRSHGGLAEQEVPFVLSHPLKDAYRHRARAGLRNFDIFDFALNGVC